MTAGPHAATGSDSLGAYLAELPPPLRFGTSGRRGQVIHLTQLEVYLNARAELEYLCGRPPSQGGLVRGDDIYFAYDLRPSSTRFVPEQQGRGEIVQAIQRAIQDSGLRPVNLGAIPTPALANYAWARGKGSIMITGSHIPFDRNGYKTNSGKGELLKADEGPIEVKVEEVRQRLYNQPYPESAFDRHGFFKAGHQELPPESNVAQTAYRQRYLDFFAGCSLQGLRLVVYQHSAVGRDLLVEIVRQLGAEAIPVGRSDTFVPIDTENVDDQLLTQLQTLAQEAWRAHGKIDAIVSADGDSDRPLLLAVEPGLRREAECRVRFLGGDLLGMVTAEYLAADAVVVPISCNDAVDQGVLKDCLQPKTRIGSPYVIAGMKQACAQGRRAVCGWEANGGFLTGTDILRQGRALAALPTRDALLPILSALFSAQDYRLALAARFDRLPRRFSRAALLRQFPRELSRRILAQYSPADEQIKEVVFQGPQVTLLDQTGRACPSHESTRFEKVRTQLAGFFGAAQGFGQLRRLNFIDGLRLCFDNGDVAHVRPSGNADELRIYAVADSQARADAIAALGVAAPDGILRRLERAVT